MVWQSILRLEHDGRPVHRQRGDRRHPRASGRPPVLTPVRPAEAAGFRIRFRNTGNTYWVENRQALYRLSSPFPNGMIWSAFLTNGRECGGRSNGEHDQRVYLCPSMVVAPGEEVTFEFAATMPSSARAPMRLTAQMIEEGTHPFGQTGTWLIPVLLPDALPPAPTGLTATGGFGQVILTWNASIGATSYRVKRSDSAAGPFSHVAFRTATSYADTNVTNLKTYYYVVTALNNAGESGDSSVVAATPVGANPGQLKIEVLDPAGNRMADGQSLGLNGDGWPVPNPLTLNVNFICPGGGPLFIHAIFGVLPGPQRGALLRLGEGLRPGTAWLHLFPRGHRVLPPSSLGRLPGGQGVVCPTR